MRVELGWLEAPESDVAAAMASVRRDSRPSWVPTKRQVLVHVNHCLILWYCCIVFMVIGIRVDSFQDGRVTPADATGLLVAIAVLVLWLVGASWLHLWAKRPPSPRSRLQDWRQTLTALANGFEAQASPAATFTSIMSARGRGARAFPRFAAPGVEFGNLVTTGRGSRSWQYLTVTLPAPLPHLILDAVSNDGLGSDLPASIARSQRISLEGRFDAHFRTYTPSGYGKEALYVLTPDVMVALIDEADRFNVEIIDDRLVFFTSGAADFSTPEPWRSAHAVLTRVVPRILLKADRYLDERIQGQDIPRLLAKLKAEREHPNVPWIAPEPRIGPDGRRLIIRDRRNGGWSIVGAVGWFSLLVFLYVVPGLFAFAGFMSIVDGR
ncbi:hypothetical protein [Plantibacter sp. YIM 135249]|uniref:hypothetical protein n=1 Tax=Plantibacter sp. YIM 135249 TaxID=3423918 RepID=UPI003D33B8B5